MKKKQMGKNGPVCSSIAAGFWRLNHWGFSNDHIFDFVHECIELGVTTFDHADIYGDYTCEQQFGRALSENGNKTIPFSLRSNIQIVTKCGIRLQYSNTRPGIQHQHYNTDKDYIIASVEQSLKNLCTSYIDLLLIHRPDALLNADEVAEAFIQLRNSGKVQHFGVSNFTPPQVALLQSRLPFSLVTNQIECSVLKMEPLHDGTLDQCQMMGINPMAWSPLGGGGLFKANTEKAIRVKLELEQIGMELGGYRPDQIALAWLFRHPSGIFPVLGTGKIDRIQAAVSSVNIHLEREQWYRIWSASTGQAVP